MGSARGSNLGWRQQGARSLEPQGGGYAFRKRFGMSDLHWPKKQTSHWPWWGTATPEGCLGKARRGRGPRYAYVRGRAPWRARCRCQGGAAARTRGAPRNEWGVGLRRQGLTVPGSGSIRSVEAWGRDHGAHRSAPHDERGVALCRRGPAVPRGNVGKVCRGPGVCISCGITGRYAESSGTPTCSRRVV